MRERDRLERKRWLEQQAAIEAAEQAERERPLREAEAKLKQTANQLAQIERENVLTLKDEWLVENFPQDMIDIGMSIPDARVFNGKASEAFVLNNKDYYPCPENWAAIESYMDRNGISIFDESVLRLIFERLRSLGLLRDRPEPEPEPEPENIEEPQPDPTEAKRKKWADYTTRIVVRCPITGIEYTQMQLDHNVDSETYKRLLYVMRQSQ